MIIIYTNRDAHSLNGQPEVTRMHQSTPVGISSAPTNENSNVAPPVCFVLVLLIA